MTNDRRSTPHALLIDLDDTIIDDSGAFESAWIEVCEAAARDRVDLDAAALLAEIHRYRAWYWSDPERHRIGRKDLRAATTHIVMTALRAIGRDDEELARSIGNAYRDRRDAALQLFPGAVDTLVELGARGIGLALITNGAGPTQRAKIDRFDLARYFQHILIEGEFGVGKPEELVYRVAMQELRSSPADTWMVGDNFEWEIVVPQRLGLGTVWVDRHGRGRPPGASVKPDHIVTSLRQVPDLL